jgi:glutathione S-transferase
MQSPDIVLHGTEVSGHTHRVELLLRMLHLPYRFVPSPAGVRRSAGFLALNPLGQVPVLQDGPVLLADSNAILVYLAKRMERLADGCRMIRWRLLAFSAGCPSQQANWRLVQMSLASSLSAARLAIMKWRSVLRTGC